MKKDKRTCGNCCWQNQLCDGHYICEEGWIVIRVKKNDKFGKICDNWEKRND